MDEILYLVHILETTRAQRQVLRGQRRPEHETFFNYYSAEKAKKTWNKDNSMSKSIINKLFLVLLFIIALVMLSCPAFAADPKEQPDIYPPKLDHDINILDVRIGDRLSKVEGIVKDKIANQIITEKECNLAKPKGNSLNLMMDNAVKSYICQLDIEDSKQKLDQYYDKLTLFFSDISSGNKVIAIDRNYATMNENIAKDDFMKSIVDIFGEPAIKDAIIIGKGITIETMEWQYDSSGKLLQNRNEYIDVCMKLSIGNIEKECRGTSIYISVSVKDGFVTRVEEKVRAHDFALSSAKAAQAAANMAGESAHQEEKKRQQQIPMPGKIQAGF